jgi:regulator of PEP synthase PpsR (kinase-PPPase family)
VSATPPIYAVSDATGETAEQVCQAALAQFGKPADVRVKVHGHVLSTEALEDLVLEARRIGTIVVYTLVGAELRASMRALAREHAVPAVDILGAVIHEFSRHLDRQPLAVPGLGHETDEAYFRRIEAVEFAVTNDDGKSPTNLQKAQVVLVGLSRTSKTPLSSYLANRGYRVANVPIVLDIDPPAELSRVDPRRVFALVIDPLVLMKIRRTRMDALGIPDAEGYGDLDHIRREMSWARRLYARHPDWTVIDITRKAIEETASTILEMYRERFENGLPANAGTQG